MAVYTGIQKKLIPAFIIALGSFATTALIGQFGLTPTIFIPVILGVVIGVWYRTKDSHPIVSDGVKTISIVFSLLVVAGVSYFLPVEIGTVLVLGVFQVFIALQLSLMAEDANDLWVAKKAKIQREAKAEVLERIIDSQIKSNEEIRYEAQLEVLDEVDRIISDIQDESVSDDGMKNEK